VNFKPDVGWIAKRLGITVHQAKDGIATLSRTGFLKTDGSRWEKNKERLRFPTVASHPSVRKFHSQMISKAARHLNHATSKEDFARRLITGLTIAVNPEQIEAARAIIHKALYDVAEILTQGACTEVYQMNLQLFPLTSQLAVQPSDATEKTAIPLVELELTPGHRKVQG